ncbi:GNAT family N-acetyltransferase [Photobacterium sp. GJ3]|uniref:GNAT family N-acetyltransferase n=1 Tax=Photobacterium sp. GJ3 TaxID=2829502 RepID=UPI001B8B99D2|nr:GNAT family N-acetyltransferase [Photobacterium sp. GJ3]QUJ67155.1 GNAT family N-acetyltransferase [Photobacterium sp. GJ3]
MNEIIYRNVTGLDLKGIACLIFSVMNEYIFTSGIKDNQSEVDVYEKVKNSFHQGLEKYMVAEHRGKIVGVTGMRRCGVILNTMYVNSNYHGRGIATNLINEITKGSAGMIRVFSSEYAIGFYKKSGFTEVGRLQEKNGIKYIEMVKIFDVPSDFKVNVS